MLDSTYSFPSYFPKVGENFLFLYHSLNEKERKVGGVSICVSPLLIWKEKTKVRENKLTTE